MKTKLTPISKLHYFKLAFRSLLFLCALFVFITEGSLDSLSFSAAFNFRNLVLAAVWIVFAVEMFFRFFPSHLESMGCQKQFSGNFRPTGVSARPDVSHGVAAVALSWFALNGVIGALYFSGVIDRSILLLICLFYSVCDMVCILFYCPFQTHMMKNKCCGSCRIYNWDFAMMFTPLLFVPSLYSSSLLLLAFALLIKWEYVYHLHPEYFHESTNASLACANCPEKLCSHKKQLRHFLVKYHDELRRDLPLSSGHRRI